MNNSIALELIKKWEGCKLKAYKCSAGVWTIGYGHTEGVKQGDTLERELDAERLLKRDLIKYEGAVYALTSKLNLNQHQSAALISFAYNLGTNALKNSTLLKIIKQNKNDFAEIKKQFLRWVYADGKKLKGLENRRLAEFEVYCGGENA